MTALALLDGRIGWGVVFKYSAWAAGAIALFLAPPPVLSAAHSGPVNLIKFIPFIFAVALAIFFGNHSRRFSGKRMKRLCIAVTVVSILLFFLYFRLTTAWTCYYAEKWTVVKSENYSADVELYMAELFKNAPWSCQQALAEYGGQAESIWAEESTIPRFQILLVIYFLLWISCATALATATTLMAPADRQSRRSDVEGPI